jgi:ParB family transcriptional regulator, chromosome partitioning protein
MEARRRALGRGLEALIPGAVERAPEPPSAGVTTVRIDSIVANPYQPREHFSEEALEELAASIREKGLLQPLLVRRAGSTYQLIAGERRLRAAERAGLDRVPVTEREASEQESLELALIENLQREDLNAIEEAKAFQRLMSDFGLNQDEVARRVGKTRSSVSNSVRLLQLPAAIRRRIESGELSAGHARSLLALRAAEPQAQIAEEVVRRRLSVRDTERLVRQRAEEPAAAAGQRKAVEDDLSRSLGTKVRIRQSKDGAGRIEIEFYSLAELNGLIERLSAGAF